MLTIAIQQKVIILLQCIGIGILFDITRCVPTQIEIRGLFQSVNGLLGVGQVAMLKYTHMVSVEVEKGLGQKQNQIR